MGIAIPVALRWKNLTLNKMGNQKSKYSVGPASEGTRVMLHFDPWCCLLPQPGARRFVPENVLVTKLKGAKHVFCATILLPIPDINKWWFGMLTPSHCLQLLVRARRYWYGLHIWYRPRAGYFNIWFISSTAPPNKVEKSDQFCVQHGPACIAFHFARSHLYITNLVSDI